MIIILLRFKLLRLVILGVTATIDLTPTLGKCGHARGREPNTKPPVCGLIGQAVKMRAVIPTGVRELGSCTALQLLSLRQGTLTPNGLVVTAQGGR